MLLFVEKLLENASSIIVTWSTIEKTAESIVKYGIGELTSTADGSCTLFTDGGKKKRTQYIHRVSIMLEIDGNATEQPRTLQFYFFCL